MEEAEFVGLRLNPKQNIDGQEEEEHDVTCMNLSK